MGAIKLVVCSIGVLFGVFMAVIGIRETFFGPISHAISNLATALLGAAIAIEAFRTYKGNATKPIKS